jgi:hypothetical protein
MFRPNEFLSVWFPACVSDSALRCGLGRFARARGTIDESDLGVHDLAVDGTPTSVFASLQQ